METATMQTRAEEQPKRRGRPKGSESARKRQTVAKLVHNTPGISTREIAAQTGISKTTAQAYLSKWGINKAELDEFTDNRVDIVRSKQQMILDAITPHKIEKATFKDLAVGYGILLDKDRLESGQSTINLASIVSIATKAEALQNDACIDGKE